MASIELDPQIKLALKYLHSSASDSTEQLRLTLDEVIRQTYGNSKTLGNVLPKKYLNEEKMESPRHKHKQEKQTKVPLPTQSPQQLRIPERQDDDDSGMDAELPFDLLAEDLTCVICRQIAVQAGNRLVECDACHALYHQDCHTPVVSDNDMSSHWKCTACINAQEFTATSYSKSPTKSSPPTQLSPSFKIGSPTSSHNGGNNSSNKNVVTPNINIISADKRLQIMKKKAAKQHDKRKHSK